MEQAFSNLFVSGKAKQAGKLKQQSKSKSSMKVDTSNYSVNLTAKEQKERLWQYLMEHNNNNNDSIISDDRSSSSSNSNNNKTSNNNINACPVERIWPTYDSVVAHVTMQDYQQNLVCPHDHHVDSTKLICPHGSVCCAKMELFPFPTPTSSSQKPYTGLLTPNTTVEHCLVRLSSAIRPLDQQQQQQGNQSDFTRIMVRNAVGEKLANAKIVPGAAIKCFVSRSHTYNCIRSFVRSFVTIPKIRDLKAKTSLFIAHNIYCPHREETTSPVEIYYSWDLK